MKYNILTLILVFLFTGCSIMEDYDGSCPEPEDDAQDYISLTFQLSSRGLSASRTDDAKHDEINSEWPEFEDLIYADDLAFYIYAVISETNQPLLMKVDSEDFNTTTDPHTSLSGGPVTYTLRASLPQSDFESVVPSTVNNFKLKIVAFANTNKEYKNLVSSDYNTFSNLISKTSDWTFSIFNRIYLGTGGMRSNRRIPMFGTSTIDVTRDQIYKSGPSMPINGGTMYFLRSVAKVRVEDNIASRDANGYPEIEVTAIHTLRDAHVLPANATVYENGHQVETPNSCVESETNKRREFTLDKQGNVMYGYIPEQPVNDDLKFEIKVQYSSNPADQKTFIVPMSSYDGKHFDFGTNILRNHIYTLSVDNVIGANAEVNLSVVEWDEMEYYLDYTSIVTVGEVDEPGFTKAGLMGWSDYETLTKTEEGYVIELKANSTTLDGYPVYSPIRGIFIIQTPVGAKWTATLLPIEGNPVIYFDDWGIHTPTISGTVEAFENEDGTIEYWPGWFSISSHETAPKDKPNVARLQIVVTLANGTVLEMPSNFGNYIIVQNPQ